MKRKLIPFPKDKMRNRGDVVVILFKLWIVLFIISVIVITILEIKIKYMK